MANIWNFKSLIRNDLSNQTSKPPSNQSSPIESDLKAISNSISPPKKLNLNGTTPDILSENKEILPKANSAKTLVKTKSKLNAITNNDELDKLKNELDFSNLSAASKKRPFVQSNESIHTESKLDENKKKIQSEPELKFKKIKSSNKIIASCDPKIIENEKVDSKIVNKKFKNDSENFLSTLNSIITPPPSHSTNGTTSCTSSVSSSCNYNTSPSSLSSLCLNKEQNKLKTKQEFENLEKIEKDELKKIRRRKNSASSDKEEDDYRKEKDRDRDKHRRSSNSHRRNHKRRNSNDYENDSDADSYYSYKNGHSRHQSKETKPKVSRNGAVNGSKSRPDDDETSSTVSTMSNSSSSSGEKNYKKFPESKYSQNKQPTNHNRDQIKESKNDADYIKRMLRLYDKIAFVQSTKQFDLLAKICGLVKPFSFTENSLFNFDLFTLDITVIEKLEGLVMQSGQVHSIQNNSASSLDTSKKNKKNELVKT